MITRGTTPYHSFVLPLSTEQIENLYVTYLQNGQVVLDKGLDEVELQDLVLEEENEDQSQCQVTVHLTQEDTLAFKFWPAAEKNIAVAQVRAITKNGEAYVSKPIHKRIYGVLKEGVIE